MSSKYDPGDNVGRTVRDAHGEIALTDHALHRFRERTPHDCQVGVRDAWVRGESLRHPGVAGGPRHDNPESARIYRHSDEWGVVFIVTDNHRPERDESYCDRVVATVCSMQTYDHGPARAYLHGHGPHGPQAER